MIYFTSDLHLGHANIIRHCARPFGDVREMDEVLIKNWHRRQISSEDTVYILGDLMFRSAAGPEAYLSRLPGCRMHLIVGNHDGGWMKKTDLSRYFESVTDRAVIDIDGRSATLIHDPVPEMETFDTDWLLYGHVHNNTHDACWPRLTAMPNALNCCVEMTGYQPLTFEELLLCSAQRRRDSRV